MIGNKDFTLTSYSYFSPPGYNGDEGSGGLGLYVGLSRPPYLYKIGQINEGTGSKITQGNIFILLLPEDFSSQVNFKSFVSQLEELRNNVGFNITELASIFHVKRPTIYEWMNENNIPTSKNQNRIDKICQLLSVFIVNSAIEIRSYLYKKIHSDKSLYDLLLESNLNEKLIFDLVQKIVKDILLQRNSTAREKDLVGFNPVSDEHKKKVLVRLTRRIG